MFPNLLGYGVHKIILWGTQGTQEQLFGVHTNINTDPDMQYKGTSTSLQKKNVGCQLREQEMARMAQKNFGGKFRHHSEK